MNSTLGLTDKIPEIHSIQLTPEQQSAKASQVRNLGIAALLLLITGFIPIIGFIGLIASFLLSKKALRIAMDYPIPDGYDTPARWASVISSVFLIFSVFGLFMLIMRL